MTVLQRVKFSDRTAVSTWIREHGVYLALLILVVYNVVATTKGEDAFTTKAESKCSLWK